MDYLSLISTPLRFAVAITVFLSRQLMVIGPTPPGTGVIKLAFSIACEKSTSPTIRYSPFSFSWVSICRYTIFDSHNSLQNILCLTIINFIDNFFITV